MAEDKNTVGLTIKIGELESFIKDTLGSSKGTAWENVSIINKSGASHEIVASSFIKRAISSSKKTGVPLSEVFTKLEPYPDAIHTFSGKQIVSTVKGHPGSVTMHKTLSLTDGTTTLAPHTVAGKSSAPKVNQVFDSDIYRGQTSHNNINYGGHNLKRTGLVLTSMNAKNPGAVRAILPKGTPDDPSIRYGKVLNPGGGFPANVTVESNIKGTYRPIGASNAPSVASGALSLGTGGGNRGGGGGDGGGNPHQENLFFPSASRGRAAEQTSFKFDKQRMLDARLGTVTNLKNYGDMGFTVNGSKQGSLFEPFAEYSSLDRSPQQQYPRALIGTKGRGSRASVFTYTTTRDAHGREFTMWLNPMTGKHERSYINKPTTWSRNAPDRIISNGVVAGPGSYEELSPPLRTSSVPGYNDTTEVRKLSYDRNDRLAALQKRATEERNNLFKTSPVFKDDALAPIHDMGKVYSATKAAPTNSWVDRLYQLVQRPAADGSAIDVIDKAARPRVGGGGSGSSGLLSGGESLRSSGGDGGGKRSGGLRYQIAEQFRHAAVWSVYAPLLGAGMFAASRMIGGDPYTDKAAHSLIGVGMGQKERNVAKRWAVDQAIANPFTTPQQHLASLKETASGLGIDPTPENMYALQKSAKSVHHYASYTRMNPELAARSLSKQATMVQKVASGYSNKSTATIMNEMASMGASLAKTSPVTGQEIEHAMQVAGPSLMGKEGLNWSPAQTMAFFNTFMSAGLNSSNIATVAKHIGSGMPFVEQMAKTELFMEQLKRNIDKQGASRAAVPLHLLKGRDYYMSEKTIKKSPEETHMFGNRISEISQLLKSGDQSAIMNRIQQYGIETNYITDNFPKGRNFINQTDIAFAQFLASMPKGQPAQDVVDSAAKLQKEKDDIRHSEARTLLETSKGGVWSSLKQAWSGGLDALGDHIPGMSYYKNYDMGLRVRATGREYISAVTAGDTEGASWAMAKVAAGMEQMGIKFEESDKRSLFYQGIQGKIHKMALDQNRAAIGYKELPGDLQNALSKEQLSKLSPMLYKSLADVVTDLPGRSGWGLRTSNDKFELPEDASTAGLPTNKAFLEALKSLPKEIAEALKISAPELFKVEVTGNGGPDHAPLQIHTNKPGVSIPPAPPVKKYVWGRE